MKSKLNYYTISDDNFGLSLNLVYVFKNIKQFLIGLIFLFLISLILNNLYGGIENNFAVSKKSINL